MRTWALWTCLQVALATAGPYRLIESYVSNNVFSKFTFWNGPDPSRGAVDYADSMTAQGLGLAQFSDGRVYLGVDKDTVVEGGKGRRSVRIQSVASFNGGLFVLAVDHVPTGCGVWPAFWMYGEDSAHIWPTWGEYDIIEGTHLSDNVMTSLHTAAHCDQSRLAAGRDFLGSWDSESGVAADNCSIDAPDQSYNQGCSQLGPSGSLGAAFNSRGGGTWAAEWDPIANHIRTWFWPMGSEPSELLRGRPEPSSWGVPYSYFTLDPDVCSPEHFINMRLVLDINFCGELGDATFAASCPNLADQMSCRELVEGHPEKMAEAFWSIRTLDVYQREQTPSPVAFVMWMLSGLAVVSLLATSLVYRVILNNKTAIVAMYQGLRENRHLQLHCYETKPVELDDSASASKAAWTPLPQQPRKNRPTSSHQSYF